MIYCYNDKGEKKKAVAMAQRLPEYINREMVMASILEGDEKFAATQQLVYFNIHGLLYNLCNVAQQLKQSGETKKALAVMHRGNTICDIVLVDSDHDLSSPECFFYRQYAELLIECGDHTNALSSLKKMAEFAVIKYDEKTPSRSILFDKIDKSKWESGKNYPESEAELALTWLNSRDFNPIRETDEFKAILASLQKSINEIMS